MNGPGERGMPRTDEESWSTLFEPYRARVVEPLPRTTGAQRRAELRRAGYNLFNLDADLVTLDLLTDSGTSAVSAEQQSAMARGDEAYAGSHSFRRFEEAVRALTGLPHVLPTHQGRAAERILFTVLDVGDGIVLSNSLFDTTRANVEARGLAGVDLPSRESEDLRSDAPFKGNADLERMESLMRRHRDRVVGVVMTVTNNTVAGQAVSLENMRRLRAICDASGVPLFLDAARFAENAALVQQREPGQAGRPCRQIAADFFALADGCLMSAKKDAFAPIGGFLALRDGALAEKARELLILGEGFSTYGGMAGHDLEAVATGLGEVTDEAYLHHRSASVAAFTADLRAGGLPVAWPPSCHAVYVDAARLLPHVPPSRFPGQAMVCALYEMAGIRACELGSLAFGRTDPVTGEFQPAPRELVRLAVPRRVYSRSHLEWVVEVLARLAARAETIQGLRMVWAPPALRHFSARFEPWDPERPLAGTGRGAGVAAR